MGRTRHPSAHWGSRKQDTPRRERPGTRVSQGHMQTRPHTPHLGRQCRDLQHSWGSGYREAGTLLQGDVPSPQHRRNPPSQDAVKGQHLLWGVTRPERPGSACWGGSGRKERPWDRATPPTGASRAHGALVHSPFLSTVALNHCDAVGYHGNCRSLYPLQGGGSGSAVSLTRVCYLSRVYFNKQ